MLNMIIKILEFTLREPLVFYELRPAGGETQTLAPRLIIAKVRRLKKYGYLFPRLQAEQQVTALVMNRLTPEVEREQPGTKMAFLLHL